MEIEAEANKLAQKLFTVIKDYFESSEDKIRHKNTTCLFGLVILMKNVADAFDKDFKSLIKLIEDVNDVIQ